MIIELQLIDIFAELGAYLFIREFVRDRGYLVCIDGLHYLHLPLIDRKRLGADLVKVIWSPDLLDGLNEERRVELKAAIKRAGRRPGDPVPLRHHRGDPLGPVVRHPAVPGPLRRFAAARGAAAGDRRRPAGDARSPRAQIAFRPAGGDHLDPMFAS